MRNNTQIGKNSHTEDKSLLKLKVSESYIFDHPPTHLWCLILFQIRIILLNTGTWFIYPHLHFCTLAYFLLIAGLAATLRWHRNSWRGVRVPWEGCWRVRRLGRHPGWVPILLRLPVWIDLKLHVKHTWIVYIYVYLILWCTARTTTGRAWLCAAACTEQDQAGQPDGGREVEFMDSWTVTAEHCWTVSYSLHVIPCPSFLSACYQPDQGCLQLAFFTHQTRLEKRHSFTTYWR